MHHNTLYEVYTYLYYSVFSDALAHEKTRMMQSSNTGGTHVLRVCVCVFVHGLMIAYFFMLTSTGKKICVILLSSYFYAYVCQ